MSTKSRIEWTEQTWNPTVGCSKVSPGCAHCYAEVMARRLQAMGVNGYENGFALTLLPKRLDEPLQPQAADSLLRQFHERSLPRGDSRRLHPRRSFDVIRPGAATHLSGIHQAGRADGGVFRRIWRCATATPGWERPWKIRHGVPRLDWLRQVPARIRFISAEPLLEDLGTLDLRRHSLGHRRRRVRAEGPAHEAGVGA